MANNQATFNLGIKTSADLTGINQLKKELQEVRKVANISLNNGFDANEIRNVLSAANNLEKAMNLAFDPHINTVNIKKFNDILKSSGTSISGIRDGLSMMGESGNKAFLTATTNLLKMNSVAKQTTGFLDSISKTIGNTIRYQAINMAIQKITGSISEASGYVKNLDNSLNHIQIVTDKNTESMRQFAKEANKAAQAMGASTTDYTDASLIYYQQGLDDSAVKERTDATIKMANVLGESADEVSNYMTAIWNNFDDGSKSLEYYGDVITALGAATASSAAEIADGLEKFAAVGDTVGLSYEYATAALATVVAETRQSADTVGTAFKTLFARIQDLEQGDTLEDGTTLGKYSQALEKVGINIKDQQGELKSMNDILDEMGAKWNTLSKDQQVALAQNVAGTRQYTQLVSLMNNWDKVKENVDLASDSTGTLNKQQEIYMQSTKAHLETMSAAWENLFDSLLQTDTINNFADTMTVIGNSLANFSDSIGGLVPLLTSLGGVGLKVFSNQIGTAIGGVTHNLYNSIKAEEIFANNLREVSNLFDASSWTRNTENKSIGQQVILDSMVSSYEKISSYHGLLTKEEEENYRIMLQEQEVLGNQALEVENIYNNFNNTGNILDGFLGIFNQFSFESLFTNTESIEELNAIISQTQELLSETTFKTEELKESLENGTADLSLFKDYQKEITNFINGLLNIIEVDEEVKNSLLSLFTQTGAFRLDNVTNELVALETPSKNAIENTSKLMEQFGKASGEASVFAGKIQELNNSYQDSQNKINNFINNKSWQMAFTQISNLIGSFGQLFFAIQQIQNIGKILSDDSLSNSEKFIKTVTSLSLALPMVVSGINGCSKAIKALKTEVFKESIAESVAAATTGLHGKAKKEAAARATEQVLAEKSLVKVLWEKIAAYAILHPELIALVITSAAVATGAYAIAKAYDKENEAARKAAEEAKKLEQAYNDTKNAYQELLSSINDYKNAKDALSSLTRGTEEFSNAIEDANSKAIELLENYNGLTYSRDNNGLILIDDKSINRIEKAQKASLNIAQTSSLNAKIASNNANLSAKEASINQSNVWLTKESIQELALAVTEHNEEDINKIAEQYIATRENAADGLDIDAQTEWNTWLERSIEELKDLGEATNLAKTQNQLYIEELVNSSIRASGLFDDLDPSITAEIANVSAKEVIENSDFNYEQEDINKEKGKYIIGTSSSGAHYNFTDNDLKQYAEIMSSQTGEKWQFDKKGIGGYNYSYWDGTKTVKETANADNIAEALARQTLSEKSQNASIKAALNNKDSIISYSNQLESKISKLGLLDASKNSLKEDLISYFDGDGSFDVSQYSIEELLKLKDVDWSSLIGKGKEDAAKEIENIVQEGIFNGINNYDYESDINVASSLLSKVSSDKKLTKTQLKEAAGEENTLEERYSTELADFDNQSQLQQVDNLRSIIKKEIQANNEYMENAQKLATEALPEQEKAYQEAQKAFDNFVSIHKDKSNYTQEEIEKYNALSNTLEETKYKYEELSNIAENGLSFSTRDDIVFDNMVSAMDGVISEAEVLKKLADDVGASWTLAADKIENFGKNFPELLQDQANYNILQDGSLQLTEAGRAKLEEVVELRKKDIIAQAKQQQAALLAQAQIEEANADYYTKQAEALKNYLENRKNGANAEATLENALSQAKIEHDNKVNQIIADNSESLSTQLQTDNNDATVNAIQNATERYNAFRSEAAAAATVLASWRAGELIEPELGPPSGGGAGVNHSGGGYTGSSTIDTIDIEALSKETDAQIEALIQMYENKATEELNERNTLIAKGAAGVAEAQAMANSLDNAVSGKGNGKSSGGSSSKDKNKKIYEEEFDVFHDLTRSIEEVEDAMSDLEKEQSHLFGHELAASLRKENKLLEKQKANYEQMAESQRKQMGETAGQINAITQAQIGCSMSFDAESGEILNYAEITMKMLEQYNKAIDDLNKGIINQTQFSIAENNYNNFKKYLENYEGYVDQYRDTQNKLEDIKYKEIENNFKAWEAEIQIELDLEEAKREWKQFLREINKDFKLKYPKADQVTSGMKEEADSLVKSINMYKDAMKDIEGDIDSFMSGGSSDKFASMSEAQNTLKEYLSNFESAAEALYQLYQDAWDAYLDGIDSIADQFQDIIDKFDRIADTLDHESKMLELLYGSTSSYSYGVQEQIAAAQMYNSGQQMASYRDQAKFWEDQYNQSVAMNGRDSEDAYNTYKYWQEAIQNLHKMEEQYIEQAQAKAIAAVNKVYAEIEEKMTSGLGYDWLSEEWDMITGKESGYYDTIETLYQLQSMQNKWNKLLTNTSSARMQQKLAEVMDEQLRILNDKEHLSEKDVEIAEKRLALAQAQAELEDAQNNKNTMKLTRNAQGNWTYQYVADADELAEKQQEVLDKQNDLYELTKNALADSYKEIYDAWQEYQSKLAALDTQIATTNDEVALQTLLDKRKVVQETALADIQQRLESLNGYQEAFDTETAASLFNADPTQMNSEDLATYQEALRSKANSLMEFYNANKEVNDLIEADEAETSKSMSDMFSSSVSDMIGMLIGANNNDKKKDQEGGEADPNGEGGGQENAESEDEGFTGQSLLEAFEYTYSAAITAEEGYVEAVEEGCELAGEDYTKLEDKIADCQVATESLQDATTEMVAMAVQELTVYRQVLGYVEAAWYSVKDSVIDAGDTAIDYLEKQIEKAEEYLNELMQIIAALQEIMALQAATGVGPSSGPSEFDPHSVKLGNGSQWTQMDRVTYGLDTNVYSNKSNANGLARISGTMASASSIGLDIDNSASLREQLARAGHIGVRYATGGYTGSWNNTPKLAWLDQKELILNSKDTDNMLDMVNTVRSMGSSIDNSVARSMANMVANLIPSIANRNTSTSNNSNIVIENIEANFPNADDVSTIQEAILSLPNIVSQYVNR